MNDRIYVVLFLLLCGMACTDNTPAIAPTENDAGRDTLAFHYNQLGDDENHRGNYASALTYYQKSMDLALNHEDSAQYYASMLDRAMVFEKSGDHAQAILQSKPVIDAYIRHQDSAALGRAYATVAIFYMGNQHADTARALLGKSFPLIEKHGSPIEMSAALNQMAFTYSDKNEWAMALPYLDSAWHGMLRTGIPYNKAGLGLNLGNCYREMGQWTPARHYIEQAISDADSMGQMHVKARALERLSQIEEATGNPSKALTLFRSAKVIRDTLLNREKLMAVEALKTQYETAEKERQIEQLKIAGQNAVRARNTTLIIALLVGLLLLVGLAFLYHFAQNRKRLLEQNTVHLKELTQLLLDKNELIRNLNEQLQQHSDQSIESPLHQDEFSPYDKPILTREDWVLFIAYFDRLYPGLVKRLRECYPQLSESEERVFLFLKLNMTRNEMAFLSGVSADAIKKVRHRLRKRLQLHEEDDLEAFVRGFG